MRVLQGSGLSKSYGSALAVGNFSFELKEGEALGLIGESGSGKSTIARVVAGLEPADSGSLHLDDRVIGTRRSLEDRRAIQMIFQDPLAAMNPRLTILEAVQDFLTIHRTGDRKARHQAAVEAIASVHLSARAAARRPHELSGGQRQRACIARALALEPRVLIADEPTSALDASIQGQILNLVVELQRARNMCVIFISHDMAVVSYVADQIIVLRDGLIVEEGSKERVIRRPVSDYTTALVDAALGDL